jgi:D-glycero-beta-D-manno-heptose-7-phosphate kinase
MKTLAIARVRKLLAAAPNTRVLALGDIMLDRYVWGRVTRISPEAPVPVLDYVEDSVMPGGAANVARNLAALQAPAQLLGVVGKDESGRCLRGLFDQYLVGHDAVVTVKDRATSVKTRIIAHRQQLVRVDRETRGDISPATARRLLRLLEAKLDQTDAIIVGDYGKGVVTQTLLDAIKTACRERGIWLSLDPKPVHRLNLQGLSLITPNRKEAFELAGLPDDVRAANPLEDSALMATVDKLLNDINPAVLLITLGEQGMLLCQRHRPPFHIPTVAQAVFDVSGAGDTVIASFTLAIASGASPNEAAIFSNHAAGVVVGKLGTATASPEEILASFQKAS